MHPVGARFAQRNGMWRRAMSRRRRVGAAGFTVLEILVILGVLAIFFLIVGPLTVKMMVRLRIESFADQVGMLIQRTRSQAVRENAAYTVDWAGDNIVPSGPGISDAAILLAADAHGLSRYAAAPCLDYDGDGDDESVDPPLTFDGLGTPSGLVAFCFTDQADADGKNNVMQVRLDSTSGIVKIAKLIDDSMASAGVRFADETEKFKWEWY
jgi:Tfp pilus assembly protein FimT